MLTALMLVLAAQTAPASIKLATVEWQAAQISRELATHYNREFATMLRRRGLDVVTQDEIATALSGERQRELMGFSDANTACLIELANALGTAGTVLGAIAKLDQTYRVQLKVLDGRTGKVMVETVAEADGERKLVDELEAAASRIASALKHEDAPVAVEASGGLRKKAWAPAVAGGALVIGGAVLVGLAYGKKGEIEALPANTDASTQRSTGAAFQTAGWLGVGIGVAALAGAGAMYLFGDSPVAATAMVTPQGAGLAVGGNF